MSSLAAFRQFVSERVQPFEPHGYYNAQEDTLEIMLVLGGYYHRPVSHRFSFCMSRDDRTLPVGCVVQGVRSLLTSIRDESPTGTVTVAEVLTRLRLQLSLTPAQSERFDELIELARQTLAVCDVSSLP
jgi:hypothetical protein